MEEIEKLHEVVVKQGLYTKSLDEFKQKYSDKESIDKLYSVVSEKGLYTKEKDNFYDKYFPSQKKNQVGNGDSTAKETPSVSSSKIQPVTSLGGEKIPTAKASATSTGVKITPFKGFSKEEMTQMKKPESVIKQEEKQPLKSVKKAPLYAKQLKLQRELSTAVVTPENQDEIQQKTDELAKIKSESMKSGKKEPDFVDSLVANLDAGLFSFAKAAVKDAPEMAWDLTTTIGATAADILGDETLAAMTKYKADDVAKILGFRNLPAEQLEQSIKRANSVVQEYNDKNGGDALTALSNGNYLGASKMIAGSTMQSLPLMLGAMVTGGGTAALGTISAASGAMKYGELKQESPELSTEKKLASAVASGILEGFVGKFFSGVSGSVAKKIMLDKGVEEGSKIIAKGFKSMAMNAVEKSPIIGLVGEVAEEGGVEFGNQTIEIANGTRDSYDFKKIGNAGISATGMGITNTVAVYGAKGYIKLSDYNKVKNTNKEIFKLTNELSNPNLTDFDKSVLSQRVDRLVTDNKKIVGDGLEKIKALPNEVKSEIVGINSSLEDLKNKVLDLEDNFVLSDDTKSSMIQEIKYTVKELTDRKLKIIEGTYIYDDFNKLSDAEKIDRKDKAGTELLNQAKAKGAEKVSFDDAQITKKAVEDYGNERKQRSDREAANQEKPTGDQTVSEYTQPTGEGEKGVRSVQEEVKNIVDNKIKTGLGVSESYSDIESVPEFMKPLAKPGAKGETTVNGVTKQTQRYSVIATAEELQDAYDNFYGKEEKVTPTEADSVKKIESLRQDEQQELLDSIPNASNALTDGKVDKDKLTTPEDKAKFDEIYNKYDKLITPLLEVTKPAEAKVTTTEKTIETKDFDLKLPNNKDNIIVVDTTNGFALYNSETNRPIEVLNENAGKENVGISKPYDTQEEAQARIEELKTKPTEIKTTPDVVSQPIDLTVPKVEIKDKSTDELEKRQAELDEKGFKSFTKESEEFGEIDKELERREWKSVLDSSLEDIPSIVDSLMKKEKEMPNGYGSYMEKKDARETKDVAEKYSKPVTKQESKKDFKDSFFGNPDTWYADGLKMRESVRSFLENGGTFKELLQGVQKEFESDGFSEQEAASVVKSKLDKIKKVNEPIDLGTPKVEVKPTEPTVAETPVIETPKESKARQTLVDKTKNAEAELKDAWKNLGNLGAIYDPKVQAAKQVAMNKAIVKYVVNKIALSAYDVNAFVKDMASNGIELTKEGADFLFDKSQKAYKTQIEKLTGVSRKPSVGQARQQKVINKAYSVGVATQKVETEAQKQKTKAAKAEISDLKKQFNDVISAIKTEKDISKKEALQKQANKLNEKISDLREKSKLKVADLKEKARLEISDLKAQFNDIMSAIKTERDIVKKEALQKQAEVFKEKIADIKAKLTESKTEVKDLKGQVRDVFKAAVEAVRQAKANARTDAKAYSDFVAMKQAALADYLAKNLSGKITAKEAASIIMSVSQATDKAIEAANKLIGKVAKRTEREAKDKLKESIKENLKEGKITSSKKGVKNIKVTLSAKRYLLDARKIDLEPMDIDQLTQLDKDIEDVLATGVATRKAMNEVIKRRRRDIEAEAIVRYERKFKQGVESDNIDMYETLKAKNIVILEDGTVFFPEDYEQTEFMPPQKGTVISENATKQQANKSFLDKSGFPAVAKYVYSKLGEIPKYHFSLTYRFYDILSDTESQDFFNKNVFDKLEKFRNRVDNRATNYSKSLNDKIYGTQPVNKKLSTLFKSNLFKTARVFAKKEGLSIGGVTLVKKGVTENIEFGQTDLVLEERTGKKENILKGATNSEVINLYNSLRDYKFLTKTFMKGGRFDLNDALKVINYVNQNPELRRRAEALVDTYAEIAVDLSAKMDEIGKNLNVGEYLTEDEYRASSLAKNNGDQAIANAQTAQYMSILRAFYGNNIPKIIPYVPISAEKVSSESSTGSEILDGKGFYNPSLAFPNLLERKGGGNLVLKSYQESFDEYTKNVSRFIEGNDLLSDFTAMFNGDHSKKILTQQFGEQWVKKANDGLVETILENDRSLNSPMSKFISLGAVNVLLFNPTSATSQLSSAPGFLASLNESERKEYFKIMKDSNKRKEYQSKILNSNYIANRANMSNHEYDAAMLKRLSIEGGMFSFGGLVGDFISDAMILTSLSDAASIVYGGSGLFGVKYEAKLKEYLRTMNRADASKKAEEEAMLDLASASEKTQQSSQVAFVSEFRRNPVLRALGATAFASSSLQAGEMAIKSFRDLKNGRGDKGENIKKVLYFGTLAPTIFTLTAALIRGAFDDDDDPLVKVANDALNTSLEQLTTVGKVVAMVKDYYLEQYAPEAVGLRMKYDMDDNDLIVKYGSDVSPGLGVKIRDIKAAIDSKGKRTIVERSAAGVQAATNVPLKRMVDIGTNFSIAFNSEYANMVRLKGLFLQIPESERFKHREHIESIKKQANELVRLSPEQSIVASKIKDPIEKKRFVDDALLERKFKFINYRLNEWFKDGYSDTKNAERMQQEDDNAIEDITENYLRDYVDATLNKDDKAVVESLDKLLDRIDYYEKNNSSAYAAIADKLDSKITEILKEDVEYFASVKQFSKGRPRAVAIYSKIGAMLTEDFESPGAIGIIRALDSEGLLDDSTIKEYYKYVQEKKREAK